MFAGVGCFSIQISRQVPTAKIYSIDLNPVAFQFMTENVRLNRVFEKVLPILGDSKEVIETRLQKIADRVLMPLPEKAIEYLPAALIALKPSGGWIHVHAFEHAAKTEDAIGQVKSKVVKSLETSRVSFNFGVVREVRSIGPNWYQIVADVQILSSSLSS
jgi:tRNA (guanine37-N1)-methyltransferase